MKTRAKVIMYLAPTPNGMISRAGRGEYYVSKANWKLFVRKVKEAGNVIIGRTTFEVAARVGVFPIKGALNVVMTSKNVENRWGKDAFFTDKKPREVLNMLKKKGFVTIILGGGSGLNTSFIKEGLVDEMHLDYQPIVFGYGVHLFAEDNFETRLRLIGTKRLSKNEIQLRYKVLKGRGA